ncbi:MAG: ribosome maturation factor RimP [Candidatus Omnitrophica bacterium]|nr:ribosome maturation factor RimP [Candidatus Omnitrophota bacterium]
MMDSTNIIERTKELIGPYLKENGIEPVDITYRRESGGMILRLLVDTPEGIRIDECEAVNNALSELLDKEDFIGEHYVIEVSSPGLDRPIKTNRDFERSMGKELEVATFYPIDGRKLHIGCLAGMNQGEIVLEANGISTMIPRDKIAIAKLHIEF